MTQVPATLVAACGLSDVDELDQRQSGGPGAAGTRRHGPGVDAAGAVSGRAAGPAAGDGRQDHQRVHQDEPAPVLRHIPRAGACGPVRACADPAYIKTSLRQFSDMYLNAYIKTSLRQFPDIYRENIPMQYCNVFSIQCVLYRVRAQTRDRRAG